MPKPCKSAIVLLFSILSAITFAQKSSENISPYLALVLKLSPLKTEARTASKTMAMLPPNAQLYIFSSFETDGYLKAIDIKTNKLGYINKSSVRKTKELPLSQSNSFEGGGLSSSSEPEVVIKNASTLTISLAVGEKYFSLAPGETSTETIRSGDLLYTASAPSVIPLSGRHYFTAGEKYNWTFSIRTSYHSTGTVNYSKRTKRKKTR